MTDEPKNGATANNHQPEKLDWKNSPLVVGAGAVVVTATFMGTVVVPLLTSYLSSQLEETKAALAALSLRAQKLEARLETAELTIKRERSKADEAQQEAKKNYRLYQEARLANAFVASSPYPIGLDKIRIGSPAGLIMETYPNYDWRSGEQWIQVGNAHPIFDKITFYLTGADRDSRVTHITYRGREDIVSPEWIVDQLTATYGNGEPSGKLAIVWKAAPKYAILYTKNFRDIVVLPHGR